MQIIRHLKRVKIGKQLFIIKQLFPVDFLASDAWPWNIYAVGDEGRTEESRTDLFAHGIKPKEIVEKERSESEIKFKIFQLGIQKPAIDEAKYKTICADVAVYNRLLFELYVLAYGLNDKLKLNFDKLAHVMLMAELTKDRVSRKHLEWIYAKAKFEGREPYAAYTDTAQVLPELFHPRRFNFNQTVFVVGREMEIKLAEEQARRQANG